ncbi:MAG: hypothetical protein ACE5EN_09700, partial [Nitrospinota bacterium]
MRHRLFVPLILIIATLALFGPAIGFDFVNWDDNRFLYESRSINPPSMENALNLWTKPDRGLYIPLTGSAWSLLAWLSHFLPAEPYV